MGRAQALRGRAAESAAGAVESDPRRAGSRLPVPIIAGNTVPAGTVAHIDTSTVPEAINHFQQLNSATIAGAPGVSQAEVLNFLRNALQEVAPTGYNVDYSGQSRQFVRGSSGFVATMIFALV